MVEQRVELVYVKYIVTAPRVLKDYPQYQIAYATSKGTNCKLNDVPELLNYSLVPDCYVREEEMPEDIVYCFKFEFGLTREQETVFAKTYDEALQKLGQLQRDQKNIVHYWSTTANHYDWLDLHLMNILNKCQVPKVYQDPGIIEAHGDKAYNSKTRWMEEGIPFYHGVAMYLLTRVKPYSDEVRNTAHGWVDPFDWISTNYSRFKDFFPAEDNFDKEL